MLLKFKCVSCTCINDDSGTTLYNYTLTALEDKTIWAKGGLGTINIQSSVVKLYDVGKIYNVEFK